MFPKQPPKDTPFYVLFLAKPRKRLIISTEYEIVQGRKVITKYTRTNIKIADMPLPDATKNAASTYLTYTKFDKMHKNKHIKIDFFVKKCTGMIDCL